MASTHEPVVDGSGAVDADRGAAADPGSGVHGARLRALAPLAVSALYSLALLSIDALSFEPPVDGPLIVLASVLWLVLLVHYVYLLHTSDDRRATLRATLSYPLLLLAPLLGLTDTSWPMLLVLAVSYVLQLRTVAAGEAFAFSFGLVIFVALVTSGGMVVAEQDQPDSPLKEWPNALSWSFVSMLRLGDTAVGRPVSDDGRTLSLVVGVCAVLATGLLTAQLVKWVSGVDDQWKDSDAPGPLSAPEDIATELARLQLAVTQLTERIQSLPDPATVGESPAPSAATDPAGPERRHPGAAAAELGPGEIRPPAG